MGIVVELFYIMYMVVVDIPVYINLFLHAESFGQQYLTLSLGFIDIKYHWIVSFKYEDWIYAMIWMSFYFSFAVWISLYIINGPRMDGNLKFV